MSIVVGIIALLVCGSLMGKLLRKRRRELGVAFVQVQEGGLDVSELVHRVPAKTRRAP